MSPTLSRPNDSMPSSPSTPIWANSCMRPDPSWMSANATLPCDRIVMIRPAILAS
jgi:hypothetical protein